MSFTGLLLVTSPKGNQLAIIVKWPIKRRVVLPTERYHHIRRSRYHLKDVG